MTESERNVTILPYERLVGEWPTRFHLRIDPDASGLLLANASEAAWLSPVGVKMVRGILEERPDEEIVSELVEEFSGAPASQVKADLTVMHAIIADLSEPGDNYPITNLSDPEISHWERSLGAPLRADIDECDYERFREMIARLWDAGVPHVTVQVDPERDHSELGRLVEAAEDIGMICGVRAVTSWLLPETIEQCAMGGFDHLDLLFAGAEPHTHNAIAGEGDFAALETAIYQCRGLGVSPVAEVPLTDRTLMELEEISDALQELEVTNVVAFAIACGDDDEVADAAGALPARALAQVATTFFEMAEGVEVRYLWAPPKYFDPAKGLEQQIREGPRTSGDVTIRVEADGVVWPARGAMSAGNLLSDSWADIWKHEAFTRYRELLKAPTRCPECPDLPICRADCPKDPEGWSDDRASGDTK